MEGKLMSCPLCCMPASDSASGVPTAAELSAKVQLEPKDAVLSPPSRNDSGIVVGSVCLTVVEQPHTEIHHTHYWLKNSLVSQRLM